MCRLPRVIFRQLQCWRLIFLLHPSASGSLLICSHTCCPLQLVHKVHEVAANFRGTHEARLRQLPHYQRLLFPCLYSTDRTGLTRTAAVLLDVMGAVPGMANEEVIKTTGAAGLMHPDLIQSGGMGHRVQHLQGVRLD